MTSSKILIAYFSHSGNTEIIARKIQRLTDGILFEIKTAKSYPENYYRTVEIAKEEKRQNARPELISNLDDINPYEAIFLGYPNWWGTMPMAVFTFLESYDFSGKTIIPFCTHEGSGMGSSERDIKKLCPNAKVLPGLPIRGSSVTRADSDIANWLKRLNFISFIENP